MAKQTNDKPATAYDLLTKGLERDVPEPYPGAGIGALLPGGAPMSAPYFDRQKGETDKAVKARHRRLDMLLGKTGGENCAEPRPGAGIGALLPRDNPLTDLAVCGEGKTLGDVLKSPGKTWLQRVHQIDPETADINKAAVEQAKR